MQLDSRVGSPLALLLRGLRLVAHDRQALLGGFRAARCVSRAPCSENERGDTGKRASESAQNGNVVKPVVVGAEHFHWERMVAPSHDFDRQYAKAVHGSIIARDAAGMRPSARVSRFGLGEGRLWKDSPHRARSSV